ncbi:dienelactone hydrolase family protein [Cumulibacter soli]|uniref:dienelactone hydrolase family protein n=1 Tax=Cumulibacter soli TaxID=2546344 RepID=UPI001ABA3678|nr:dienelactone hydrolase family protein [Cumulibacter soli]
MCFEPDAVPPPLPSGRAPLPGEDITLTSADGSQVLAHRVRPDNPNGRAVIVLPDVRGLYSFYKNLAGAFAAEGFDALALDYFARTADDANRTGDFDPWPHVRAAEPKTVREDIAAAKNELASAATYAVGFCFGGSHAFCLSAVDHDFAGVVGFYGKPYNQAGSDMSPIEMTDQMKVPVLGLFGGGDSSIPQDIVDAFGEEMTASGVPHELHTYPRAPHSFFDRTSDEWAEACQDAWTRTLSFMSA